MSNEGFLLRMLEPVMRPDGVGRNTVLAPNKQPIEEQSFDALLEDAKQVSHASKEAASQEVAPQEATAPQVLEAQKVMMNQLNQFDRIGNPGLRNILQQARQAVLVKQDR